ncbi:TORTIFOLIA1-like protein 3 isoform X2 [Cynara cardunculus var. scolymus]|uniref:TORTIFOLIA1-like protein 3 isoform X2 n=1 Tax=Cynara cardunculus var. scolymus TaxID=59895 RepID=UPI000D6268B5|nr:TORTIFOLIA1-like protein 3 isoform X2 [Cynara cardunculus var. scolymus]
MTLAKHSSNNQASAREFKHRVLTCLNKLSDRDTHSAAATELESIAKTLNHDSISPFLSSISATDSSDKSPVRRQCVRLISTLSEAHGDALSSHLSKLLSAVIRRLRDPDTAVRSACVAATGSIASHVTKPPFTSVAKPLVDALVTEQDLNSQIGAALCLASAVDCAPDPEYVYLRRMLPRIEKLLKCDSFKAKAALLTVLGSVISVGAASSPAIVKNLVNILVEFVMKSEDWSARKAATEALEKLAVVETELLSGFKAPCLKIFEAKKFDKVKIVRETMNQMIEAWKAIPDVPEEVLTPPESQSSSKAEVASDGRYPPRTPQITDKRTVLNGSVTANATRRISSENSNKKAGPAMFRKLERKKNHDQKLGIAAPPPLATPLAVDDDRLNNRSARSETKRALFNEIVDEEMHKSYHNARISSTDVGSNFTVDIHKNHKDCEELSMIRNQLVQIETQQSNLFELLQKFIGSSQTGMQSLETRVHGLELTLDEISFDLARSTGRLSNPEPTETVCCKLPGAEFLTSKLWKKTEIHHSNARISSAPFANMNLESSNPENRGFWRQGGGGSGLIKNPLAEVRSSSISHATYDRK